MTRTKQRFHNFEQAMNQLREALKTEKPSFLELAGIIKLFELSFELDWKVIKDILDEENLSLKHYNFNNESICLI